LSSPQRHLLVTGASGFFGSEIINAARTSGWHVRAFDRRLREFHAGVDTIIGNIDDREALDQACHGASAVIHAAGLAHVFGRAAKNASLFNEVNEMGTAHLMDAAVKAGVPKIVLVSSVSVYGKYTGASCDESQPCHPQGPYAISKWRGELRAIEKLQGRSGSLTILRFATIYGEGDRGNVAKLIDSLDRGCFIWPGYGLNQKSLIYKQDAARACVRALDSSRSDIGIYNVSAPSVTMREIVSAICDALNRPVPRITIPAPALALGAAMCRWIGDPGQLGQRVQKFLHDDIYDGSKFETTFQYKSAISLYEGMRREIDCMRAIDSRFSK